MVLGRVGIILGIKFRMVYRVEVCYPGARIVFFKVWGGIGIVIKIDKGRDRMGMCSVRFYLIGFKMGLSKFR